MNDNFVNLLLISGISFFLSYFGSSMGLMLGQIRLPLIVLAVGSSITGVGTNLAISAIGALAGCYGHARQGNIDFRLFLLMAIPSTIAAFCITHLWGRVPSFWPQIIISAVLLVSGLQLALHRTLTSTEPRKITRHQILFEILTGAICGALSGTVGLMMGTLRLSSLIRILGIDPKKAIGTNLAVGFVTAIAGAVGSWNSAHLDTRVLTVAGIATALGAGIGAKMTSKIAPSRLNRIVGFTVAGSGLLMLVQIVR